MQPDPRSRTERCLNVDNDPTWQTCWLSEKGVAWGMGQVVTLRIFLYEDMKIIGQNWLILN